MKQAQARLLAAKIEAFWSRRGIALKAFAVTEAEALPGPYGSHDEWTVRTEPPLVNGLPRGATSKTARAALTALDKITPDWRHNDDERPENT